MDCGSGSLATLIQAASAVGALIVAVLIWRITERYTKATEAYTETYKRAFRLTNRPYLVVGLSKPTRNEEINSTLSICQIRNSGTMPATLHESVWMRLESGKEVFKNVAHLPGILLMPQDETNFPVGLGRDVRPPGIMPFRIHVRLSFSGVLEDSYRRELEFRFDGLGGQFILEKDEEIHL